jgi:hypothetical protein
VRSRQGWCVCTTRVATRRPPATFCPPAPPRLTLHGIQSNVWFCTALPEGAGLLNDVRPLGRDISSRGLTRAAQLAASQLAGQPSTACRHAPLWARMHPASTQLPPSFHPASTQLPSFHPPILRALRPMSMASLTPWRRSLCAPSCSQRPILGFRQLHVSVLPPRQPPARHAPNPTRPRWWPQRRRPRAPPPCPRQPSWRRCGSLDALLHCLARWGNRRPSHASEPETASTVAASLVLPSPKKPSTARSPSLIPAFA